MSSASSVIRPNMAVKSGNNSGLVGCIVEKGGQVYFTIAAHVCKNVGDFVVVTTDAGPVTCTVKERNTGCDTALVSVVGGADNEVHQTINNLTLNKIWSPTQGAKLKDVTTVNSPNYYDDGEVEARGWDAVYHGDASAGDSGGAIYAKDGTLVGFISAGDKPIVSKNVQVMTAKYVFDTLQVTLR